MATTVSKASLVVTVTEQITLNGTIYDQNTTKTITGVTGYDKSIFTLSSGVSHNVAEFVSLPSGDKHDVENLRYLRVTNLDDTNFVVLHLEGSSHYAQLKIEPGSFFILTDVSSSFDGADAVSGYTPVSITKIDAMADTASCDIEVFVASS